MVGLVRMCDTPAVDFLGDNVMDRVVETFFLTHWDMTKKKEICPRFLFGVFLQIKNSHRSWGKTTMTEWKLRWRSCMKDGIGIDSLVLVGWGGRRKGHY